MPPIAVGDGGVGVCLTVRQGPCWESSRSVITTTSAWPVNQLVSKLKIGRVEPSVYNIVQLCNVRIVRVIV